MKRQLILTGLSLSLTVTTLAAHIITDTREGDSLVTRTHMYANSDGDLRVDEHEYAGGKPGPVRDSMVYQSRGETVVVLEGRTCRKLSANSAPPPELAAMGGNLGAANEQMAAAMKQAQSAMEQAMAQARAEGMTPEQEAMMRQFTGPAMNMDAMNVDRSVSLTALDDSIKIAGVKGKGYAVKDSRGQLTMRVWVAPVGEIKGAADVRKGYEGMMSTFKQFMKNMGGGSFMNDGMMELFDNPELRNTFPIRTEDLASGSVTDFVEVGGGKTEFYPDCEERSLMGG
ncbi:MAG: hypothetical protein AAF465_07015 [Pseudomonadota bacterium]